MRRACEAEEEEEKILANFWSAINRFSYRLLFVSKLPRQQCLHTRLASCAQGRRWRQHELSTRADGDNGKSSTRKILSPKVIKLSLSRTFFPPRLAEGSLYHPQFPHSWAFRGKQKNPSSCRKQEAKAASSNWTKSWRGQKKNQRNPFNQNQILNLFNVLIFIYYLHMRRAEWGAGGRIIYCLLSSPLLPPPPRRGHEKLLKSFSSAKLPNPLLHYEERTPAWETERQILRGGWTRNFFIKFKFSSRAERQSGEFLLGNEVRRTVSWPIESGKLKWSDFCASLSAFGEENWIWMRVLRLQTEWGFDLLSFLPRWGVKKSFVLSRWMSEQLL